MQTEFKSVHTSKDLIISLGLLAIGVGLFFVNKGVGVVLAIAGVVSLLLYKKGYRTEGAECYFQKKDLELNKSCRSSVMDYINGKDVQPELIEGNEGGSVRLVVYYNKTEGLAFAQLFDYQGYDYQPASEMVEIRRPRVDRLIDKF